jgi:hypothetical protein
VPALLEVARDKSVCRLLYSTGAEEEDDVPDDASSEDEAAEHMFVGSLFDDSDDDAESPAKVVDPAANLAPPDAADLAAPYPADLVAAPDAADLVAALDAAPMPPPVEDYVIFFERTVPLLDICIVASHGRLLLARSRSGYYVCYHKHLPELNHNQVIKC